MRAGSARTRLLVTLLAGLAVAALAVAIATANKADHEVAEVFDASLAQNASLLVMRLGEEVDEIETEHAPVLHKYAKPLSFQVWKRGRKLQLHSADVPDAKLSETLEGFSTVEQGGREWRVFSVWDEKREYLVQVRSAVADRRHVIVDIVKALAKPLLVALPVIALLVWFAVGLAFRPLARVGEELARRDPNYLEPLEGDVPREIAPLVGRLNGLLARVKSSLEGERRFASDAAHELRTPLAALRAQLQVAQGAGDAAGRERAIAQALAAGERATHVVEQLLTLARLDHQAWKEKAQPFDLHRVAADAIADRAALAGAKRIALALEGSPGLRATGHAGLAAIAAGNLIDNAIRYSPPDTEVVVRLATEGERILLRVVDQGPGIPAARRAEALSRFARLDTQVAEGSGLGLSIVARVAQLHGSPLALGEGPGGRGLEALIAFPAA